MFERYLTDALITHFGHVVENLDADKVRLSAWNGQVVLEDLRLRKNALESIVKDCPVEIAYGKVGHLELRIPWKLFKSQLRWRGGTATSRLLETNCSIVLTDVNILITPRREEARKAETEMEEAKEEEEDAQEMSPEERRERKENEVQKLLDADLLQRVTKSTTSSRWSWVQEWLSNLLSTLSVTVRNIHVRYEDPGTSMGYLWTANADGTRRFRPAFAVGITLHQFSIETSEDALDSAVEKNCDGEDGVTAEDGDAGVDIYDIHKAFETRRKTAAGEKLAIYWDSQCELMSIHVHRKNGLVSQHAMYYESSFQILNGIDDHFFDHSSLYNQSHTYLLDPISPIINLNLVSPRKESPTTISAESNDSDSVESTNDSIEAPPNTELTPPSSFSIDLPPCNFILSRSTLEDTAYIRKSISVWSQAKRGFLPESSLRRLAGLRPLQSPRQDPKSWWVYACEATIALLRVQRVGKDPNNVEFYRKRRRGWVGFVKAVSRRQRYIKLYTDFLSYVEEDNERSHEAHQILLEMEDDLFPREIVAFRIAIYDTMGNFDDKDLAGSRRATVERNENNILSIEHRSWMMEEMLQALEREKVNVSHRVLAGQQQRQATLLFDGADQENDAGLIMWKASFACRQFALQISDEVTSRHNKERRITPIIRISSAWIQDHCWYQDGSWDTDCSLASLAVKDLTPIKNNEKRERQSNFPNLVGRKQDSITSDRHDFILIDGIRYFRSLSIVVQKKLHWTTQDGHTQYDDVDRGSTTKIQVRLLPMEIVYSTLPAEALSRVLATIKTPELVNDMHRMAFAARNWRERQKRNFLQALAHKHKKIIVDIDVGSPELLIPEDITRYDSPILAVDLGRLQVSNIHSSDNAVLDFDDKWRLELSNMQVRSTTATMYTARGKSEGLVQTDSPQQLVEPFSLDLTVLTRIADGESQDMGDTTRIQISATLPRLAFNLTSSAMRLLLRLKVQWERRKSELQARRESQFTPREMSKSNPSHLGLAVTYSPARQKSFRGTTNAIISSQNQDIYRVLRFQFSAPLITLRVSNDVDGRDCDVIQEGGTDITKPPSVTQTQLVDLAFRGIRGKFIQEVARNGDSTGIFDAKLHSLGAIDLYQHAGTDFTLLLSSVQGEFLPEEPFYGENIDSGKGRKDLVAIEYRSKSSSSDSQDKSINEVVPDVLSIWFHELYVEWNPETLAAIQKALRLPLSTSSVELTTEESEREQSFADEDEFFDAEEDEFFDAGSEANFRSFSHASMLPSALNFQSESGRLHSSLLDSPLRLSMAQPPLSPVSPFFSPPSPEIETLGSLSPKPFKIIFELSKLRVSFNKEARHRKLMIAQMNGTSFSYTTNLIGGSRSKMRMGNLVFIDPSSSANETLYGQIIGLKPGSEGEDSPSSLLEMEILINSAARDFVSEADENEENRKRSVTIDRERGRVTGCNTFIKAIFSPMRFVFLEQLWFEIIDYFFEGVIGAEVWGGRKVSPEILLKEIERSVLELPNLYLPGSDAKGFNFTRFDISLESPELLLPVTYQSPHFLLFKLINIHISNHYDGFAICDDPAVSKGERTGDRMQWYNNCDIVFQGLRLYSWSGHELGRNPAVANVALKWPTGPLAPRIIPKWKVTCRFDNLDIALRRSEYALLQHIIAYNIGEVSRHLEEWEMLQSLPQFELDKIKTMVQYGYDKKDVAPTTYDVTITIPLLSFRLKEENDADKTIAIVRCMDLVWTMRKESDLVVHQKLTCDVDLVTPNSVSGFETMLSMSKYDTNISSEGITSHEFVPELTYTSTTKPSSDNVKTLKIVDPCIYLLVPAWRSFVQFFQALPEPTNICKVGDHWERIGDDETSRQELGIKEGAEDEFTWIAFYVQGKRFNNRKLRSSVARRLPKFQFRVSLKWPRIILSSTFTNSTRLILRMHHLDFLNTNDGKSRKITRSFFLHDVEVYTVSSEKPIHRINEGVNSLIHPWSVVGLVEKCNGLSIGDCERHTLQVSGDILEARASYSDMIVAIDVCLSIFHSTRNRSAPATQEVVTKSTSSESMSIQNKSMSDDDVSSSASYEEEFCRNSLKNIYDITFDGFELKVADDSGRHFAGTQDLIILSLGKLHFSRETFQNGDSTIRVYLHSLDLFDCLQSEKSPFRTAASSRAGVMDLHSLGPMASIAKDPLSQESTRRKMDWDNFRVTKDGEWNFTTSLALLERSRQASYDRKDKGREHESDTATELIEIICIFSGSVSQDYAVRLRSFAVQWNPSTIIAIQRFLGRLRKDSGIQVEQVFHEDIDGLVTARSEKASKGQNRKDCKEDHRFIHASIKVDSLTVCLNKEHQHRRLVELTLSSCKMEVDSSEQGLSVAGELRDLFAWDSDNYQQTFSHSHGDAITEKNRNILQVLSSETDNSTSRSAFLKVRYKTFNKILLPSMVKEEVPEWVQSHLADTGNIDDFLEVSVASLRFTYFRERTAEILDYLSNGLPGKGMGVTSRAAKGFITKRILTKSFLELRIDSPQVIVPQHESLHGGIMLNLGDVNMKSWFEELVSKSHLVPSTPESMDDWWRMLSLRLTGFCSGVLRSDSSSLSSSTNPIDLEVTLQKPTTKGQELAIQGKLSFLDLRMNYRDYVLLRAVVRDNIGRKVDTEKWDNVEKAYWLEEEKKEDHDEEGTGINEIDLLNSQPQLQREGRVEYSTNARFVRYGKAGKKDKKKNSHSTTSGTQKSLTQQIPEDNTTLDLDFQLDGLSLKLRRDDVAKGVQEEEDFAKAFHYDVMLLRVQLVEISARAKASGDMSFHLSLFRLGLFDLGDHGRLVREQYYSSLPSESSNKKAKRKEIRYPCPFNVLVEGYSALEEVSGGDRSDALENDAHFVVDVDRCSASSASATGSLEDFELPVDSKVTIAKILVNNLSVNALIRPFKEIVAFLTCEWQTIEGQTRAVLHHETYEKGGDPSSGHPSDKSRSTRSNAVKNQGVQLKLVAHYPRVFFLADESDPHSRALVLRGLAVVHLSKNTIVQSEDIVVMNDLFFRTETRYLTSINAQLFSWESYINPDVDEALGFKTRHSEMVGDYYSSAFVQSLKEDQEDTFNDRDTLGVALIQPVTAGIEYSDQKRDLFPTKRSIFVNIEPVSTMVSFEDLQLIETVLNRWSSKRSTKASAPTIDPTTVVPVENDIQSNAEGIDYVKESYSVVFRNERLGLGLKAEATRIVVIDSQRSEHSDLINKGDVLVAIEEHNFERSSLEEVVKHLSRCKRPTTITFETPKAVTKMDNEQISLSNRTTDDFQEDEEMSTESDTVDEDATQTSSATCYDIKFRLGISRGLQLGKSACGGFPTVTRILPNFSNATNGCSIDESNAEQIEATFSSRDEVRVPCAGAVIVAINGISVEEVGTEEAFRRLSALAFEGEERNTYSSISELLQSSQVYWLSFMEIDSAVWDTVEEIEILSSGITLSFIDDLNGRDMPLFRASMSTVKIHAERGVGIEAQILDANTPSLMNAGVCTDYRDNEETIIFSESQIEKFHSETIVTFSGLAMCAIDYFHPRIACWEPLLEPSQLFLLLESQKGTKRRPGQIAVELSDYLLHDQIFRARSSPKDTESQMLTVNITDAAAQVFVKASSQWKEWRKSVVDDSDAADDESISEDFVKDFKKLSVQTFPSSGFDVNTTQIDQGVVASHSEEQIKRYEQGRRLEAQRAAQAALDFAKKRGAETNKKGDSAKPFVFRNRTGVSIAFVHQGQNHAKQENSDQWDKNLSVVGEYSGLENYDRQSVIEIADKEDARFSMELMSDQDNHLDADESKGTKHANNKIRDYEGRFPNLTISIQAVSGVFVEPIHDLQVFKVGSEIRNLIVRKDCDTVGGLTNYSIPVVWKVEIEDNRRILTLSTAVRVVSSGFDNPIEVGVQKEVFQSKGLISGLESSCVTTIGVSRPELPFYLPLWLALRLDAVYVYVRPESGDDSNYLWSESSVLYFGPLAGENEADSSIAIGRWTWKETFNELAFINCGPKSEGSSHVQLSVFGSSTSAKNQNYPREMEGEANLRRENKTELHEVISVTVDSGLTLRNMLPMSLEWEVANVAGSSRKIVDGSLRMQDDKKKPIFTFDDDVISRRGAALESGGCTEVFSCNFCSEVLEARFKGSNGADWSSWAPLSILDDISDDDQAEDRFHEMLAEMIPQTRQINVQVNDDSLGVPLTFGVRIVPKLTIPDDPYRGRVYGLEVIVYAELWIRNITSLPLNFGCPSYQLHEPGCKSEGFSVSDESLARFTAESALMEIANLLEVGDKGTGLSNKTSRDSSESGGIESLPRQECDQLVEEVFEYIEIESSTVKRRWWASESYDSYRENPTQALEKNFSWKWMDDDWVIDCVGQAKACYGGWESCRSLFTAAGSFSGNRDFDPTHTFRRRRHFRTRSGHRVGPRRLISPVSSDGYISSPSSMFLGCLQAIHQPVTDSFSKEQQKLKRKQDQNTGNIGDRDFENDEEETTLKIAMKCGDGTWTTPINIQNTGRSHGVVRVLASRWPSLTRQHILPPKEPAKNGEILGSLSYGTACLDSDLFELCYSVSDVDGEWGEFSRSMVVSPRFLIRNNSKRLTIEVKQTGASDSSSLRLGPGQVKPFYWADFRLPGLVSVHPIAYNETGQNAYKWSGGVDICNLGMIPVRVRRSQHTTDSASAYPIQSLRAIVEVRPGTGGTGINVSFKEEDSSGDGSLFRIENLSSFPIWLAQDGNLANPTAGVQLQSREAGSHGWVEDHTQFDGDLIRSNQRLSFALDVPYRQGKYAHRKEASMTELMRIRVALAPLSSRTGIETMKVVGLTTVGESLRLNPSKVVGPFVVSGVRESLQQIRILGIVSTDGPTRVLKFTLISKPAPDVFRNAFEEVSYMSTTQSRGKERVRDSNRRDFTREILDASNATIEIMRSKPLPSEADARRNALFGDADTSKKSKNSSGNDVMDEIYSFRAEFGGFVFSFVDSAPSEIAVASLRNINALARWNKFRTTDASLILSIGWLQIDNHIPSAPFKVAVRPDKEESTSNESKASSEVENTDKSRSSPLLVVALAFAPRHKSGIMCLRSVTVAPRNLVIALDLAFLVRLQRFLQGIKGHFRNFEDTEGARTGITVLYTEQKKYISFPHFESPQQIMDRAAAFGAENKNLYFQGLTILPCNINLSVAPARALTPTQAALEGSESAAIHEAVRKGDVLVGSSSALLGVRIGRKNKTPLSVVRGVFKSIVVDALLRLDGASLNFSGVFLRNYISTGPQLTTYLLTHYLSSLRNNVPALLGSLAAFGNPLGLIRGLGDGVTDFVNEPLVGLKRSVQELDPSFLVDGVARGTGSLARHTVGGFADSASLLTETFSKNMAVLTLDRRYAQKRDRDKALRLNSDDDLTLAGGVESGFNKLVTGFSDGVTGVVKAPMRGAEKRGIEGFAKGVGKGLLGLLVKPIIGISDAATDVMIGVKSTVEKNTFQQSLGLERNQLRPRRTLYGRDKVLHPYKLDDAAAAALMLRTRCAGENYLGHYDMLQSVALFSVVQFIVLGPDGKEILALKYNNISRTDVRQVSKEDDSKVWGIVILLNKDRPNGAEIEVIHCQNKKEAAELYSRIKKGMDLVANDNL